MSKLKWLIRPICFISKNKMRRALHYTYLFCMNRWDLHSSSSEYLLFCGCDATLSANDTSRILVLENGALACCVYFTLRCFLENPGHSVANRHYWRQASNSINLVHITQIIFYYSHDFLAGCILIEPYKYYCMYYCTKGAFTKWIQLRYWHYRYALDQLWLMYTAYIVMIPAPWI